MAETGKLNSLKVFRQVDNGIYLDGEELGEIFLPQSDTPEDCRTGDNVEVFIYSDSENIFTATTQKPYAMVGDFAYLKVVSVNPVGAFLDWGLQKDLLVPFSEQKQPMEEGSSYIVYVYLDNRTKRTVASAKLDKFLEAQPIEFMEGQRVELLICNQTEIGYKAIIDNARWGMLYKNEVFQPLTKGQHIQGFIKKVRDDGKVDLCLHKPGTEKVEEVSEKIINTLKAQGGFLAVTDKSSPEIIYSLFGVSKKTYKKAIGGLYKKHLILIDNNGITLSDQQS